MNKLRLNEASKYFLIGLIRILVISLVLLFVMSGFRVLFHFTNGHLADLWQSTNDRSEVWMAYFIGFRFDLSALSYLAIFPTLVTLIGSLFGARGSSAKIFWISQKWSALLLCTSHLLLIVCLLCDFGYYSFFQDHINVMMFGLFEDDTFALLKTFWKNYPLIKWSAVLTLVSWLHFKFCTKILLKPFVPTINGQSTFDLKTLFRFVLPVVLLSLAARGSLGLFPLSVQHTVVSSRSFINILAYNGFHALIRAIKLKRLQKGSWNTILSHFGYQSVQNAFSDFYDIPNEKLPEDLLSLLHQTTPSNLWAQKAKPHVLVLVMESLGSGYFKYDQDQFQLLGDFKRHLQEDLYTLNFLPSHSSTIGSLSSLMIATPQRPEAGFLTETEFLQVPFRSSAANVFKSQGYESKFVYGGNPGWRDINKFAIRQGFDQVIGEVDIEKSLGAINEKHDWGIFDEEVFSYLEKSLQDSKTPQFILAMTTTNHPPYQVPNTYAGKKLQLPNEILDRLSADPQLALSRFRAYQYSNQKLGEFLSRMKQSSLADHLIVAVTGDHSFWMIQFSDQEHLQKWGVPFYLYLPPAIRGNKSLKDKFGSHFDIFPTLYPLALSNAQFDALGKDLLNTPITESMSLFSNYLAVNSAGGILAQTGPNAYTPYLWSANREKLIAGAESSQLALLAKKYKSLMSLLDYYFMKEAEQMKRPKQNTPPASTSESASK